MKLSICDACKKLDDTITPTDRVLRVKGKSYLNMDVCPKHAEEVRGMPITDYVRYVYNLEGIKLTESDGEIQAKFLR